MRVCVIGTGYVGLVTGACLAQIGHHVICVDNNAEKVKLMQSGQAPIFEPGLTEIMQSAMLAQRLEFTTNLGAGNACKVRSQPIQCKWLKDITAHQGDIEQ